MNYNSECMGPRSLSTRLWVHMLELAEMVAGKLDDMAYYNVDEENLWSSTFEGLQHFEAGSLKASVLVLERSLSTEVCYPQRYCRSYGYQGSVPDSESLGYACMKLAKCFANHLKR